MMGSEIHIRPYKMHETRKSESFFGSRSKIYENKRGSFIPFRVIQKTTPNNDKLGLPILDLTAIYLCHYIFFMSLHYHKLVLGFVLGSQNYSRLRSLTKLTIMVLKRNFCDSYLSTISLNI